MYVDVLLGLNLFINYFLLLSVAKFLRISVRRLRLLAGAAIGAAYSLVILVPMPNILALLCRLAASAGHVYGRNIVSNETFTWLKRPRFTETLEEMKAAVDAVFCDGMNMIVNHGYAYSPEKAGRRGWPFYASTHINHTTP